MADTYPNTTSGNYRKTEGSGKNFQKYDNNFDKGTDALSKTPYAKKRSMIEKRGDAIMSRQKKGW